MTDTKVCVVSLIGKNQFQNQTKAWKLNTLIKRNYFQSDPTLADRYKFGQKENEDSLEDFNIQTYLDAKNKILYLHMESIYDTNNLFDKLASNDMNEDDKKDFFELWDKEQSKYLRYILLIFSVSHIIIVSSPSCEFDIGYVRFFRIVDTLRNKMLPTVVDLLKALDLPISKDWIYAGRPCSPRVLFTFENCPKEIYNYDSINENNSDKLIEKLQHSLEDQIYNSLRKSYVITNISNNSLFAIPPNQEFAYIHRLTTKQIDNNKFLLTNISKDTFKIKETSINAIDLDAELFRKFLFSHTRIAINEGFNDNIGRQNVQPVFELPRASQWYKIFDALVDLILKDPPKSAKIQSHFTQIKTHLDIDAQFSENRCKKILPSALNIYEENLPSFYTKAQHDQRLEKALNYYSMNARGPLFNQYQTKLINDCNSIWLNGRQLCESISLTGHNCVNELHRLSKEGDEHESESDENENEEKTEIRSSRNVKLLLNKRTGYLKRNSSNVSRNQDTNEPAVIKRKSLPVKPHNSSIVTRAASNCGEFQRDRKDPFDLREANFSFYTEFSNMELISKKTIVNFDFPIFKPTSTTAKSSKDEQQFIQTTVQAATPQQTSSLLNLSQDFKSTNNQKNKDDLIFPSPLHEQQQNQQLSSTTDSAGTQANMIDQFKQNVVINDEVYLNGMTHSDSPPGLLPLFSSWSLVSIGKFNDYNPMTGLSQPGFLSNHNYLIPWELLLYKGNCINIFSNDKSSSKRNLEKLAKINEPPSNPINLKAYIGMEYECPMGHRFICSGPDRLVKVASNGVIKDDAYKLLYFEMPLYTACPCRNTKETTPYMAQMMRVFVVTPPNPSKTNDEVNKRQTQESFKLSICLKPRIQPNPSPCPVFYPSNSSPIFLNENSFMVLRLPYIYMSDEDKPYYRPKDFETLNNCRILKGMFSAVIN